MKLMMTATATALLVSFGLVEGAGPGQASDDPLVERVTSASVPFPPSRLVGRAYTADDVDLSSAEADDLRVIARDSGISFDTAVQRYATADEFNAWKNDISAKYPSEFSGSEWIGAEGRGWVGFAKSVPDGVVESAIAEGLAVQVSDGLGFTQEQVIDEANLIAKDGRVSSSYSRVTPNFRDGSLVLTPREGVKSDVTVVTAAVKDGSLRRPVRILDRPEPPRVPTIDSLRGGGRMSGCTAGFVVRQTGGAKGVGTAHHCKVMWGENSATYNNWPVDSDGSVATLWYDRGSIGVAGDTGVYKAGSYSSTPTFYATSNTKRYVDHAASGSPSKGSPVLKFGKTTGQSSGFVIAENTNDLICESSGNCLGRAYNLVDTSLYSEPGDSGGPVYYGNTALGVMSSRSIASAVFSPVSLFQYQGYGVWSR